MNARRKRSGLLMDWHRSFTMARWRKGKENRDSVLDSRVVLTKMKLLSSFSESTPSQPEHPTEGSAAPHADLHEPLGTSHEDGHHEEEKPEEPQTEPSSDYLSEMFSSSQLTRLYKFESEDSGVELPSGANSPSTPTGSEHSFMVHSRESSCHSENPTEPDLSSHGQSCEDNRDLLKEDEALTPLHQPSGEGVELRIGEELEQKPCRDSGIHPQEERDVMETGREEATAERRGTRDSLEEYMEQCCRLSQTHQSISGSLGSGLGYLEHICQLLEKIGQLQEVNRQLQREISGLKKDGRAAATKEEFFQQHCHCGAASLIFPDVHPRDPGCEFIAPTPSDLSTIPEVSWHPLLSRKDMNWSPASPWRRNNRRSYTEGDASFLCESRDEVIIPRRRSENYTWSRVKDLVKRNRLKNGAALGATPLKMSCPQLYRPDLGADESKRRNRNSMVLLGHQNKADFSWS